MFGEEVANMIEKVYSKRQIRVMNVPFDVLDAQMQKSQFGSQQKKFKTGQGSIKTTEQDQQQVEHVRKSLLLFLRGSFT